MPLPLLLKMFMHVLIDCIIGIIPIVGKQNHSSFNSFNFNIISTLLITLSLGDVIDVFYKANIYNMNILETWLRQKYGSNIRIYDK